MKFEDVLKNEVVNFDNIWREKTNGLINIKGKLLNIKYLLNKEIEEIYGFEFYQITSCFKINIESFSRKIFNSTQKNEYGSINDHKNLNRFEKFVNQFLVDQKDFSKKAGIDHTRLNKLLKRERNDFYAYEIYHIAISEKIKVSSAFEQLYKPPLTKEEINS